VKDIHINPKKETDIMTAFTDTPAASRPMGWFARAESWLDAKGRGAWIAAMVVAFIFFWPIGLALLAYMIWSKRMFSGKSCARASRAHGAFKTSGNTAFDAYKSDMLRRLEDEQAAFEAFLQRLRDAKDKSEFDDFMEDRAKASKAAATADSDKETA
jgi:hypothetical protein